MFKVIGTAVGAAAIGVIPQCSAAPDGSVVVTYGTHYLMDEGVTFEGDLVAGDRLDLLMVMDGAEFERCFRVGGDLVGKVCQDIDF
jgi:hypothetical protein